MLKLSSSKPSKYTRWIFASIGRFVTKMRLNFTANSFVSGRRNRGIVLRTYSVKLARRQVSF